MPEWRYADHEAATKASVGERWSGDWVMGGDVFPFIVGVGRSGTTLVRAILDSHPDLAIPGESHFIVEMVLRGARYGSFDRFDGSLFLHDVTGHPRFQRWGLPEALVRRAMDADPPRDFPSAIRRLYETYATHKRKSRYADKTPSYVYHLDILGRIFPEGRFVHIVRDGRDVALSRLDHASMPGTLPNHALLWRRGVEKGQRLGRDLGPERYLEIRYEDLVKDTEGVARSLCGFIGLEFDPVMLRYHERADEIIRPTQHPQSHARIHLPPTTGLRDWRTQMAPGDVVLFELLAGKLVEELGYERAAVRPTLGHRVTAHRKRLGLRARRVVRAVGRRVKHSPWKVGERE